MALGLQALGQVRGNEATGAGDADAELLALEVGEEVILGELGGVDGHGEGEKGRRRWGREDQLKKSDLFFFVFFLAAARAVEIRAVVAAPAAIKYDKTPFFSSLPPPPARQLPSISAIDLLIPLVLKFSMLHAAQRKKKKGFSSPSPSSSTSSSPLIQLLYR